MRKVLLDDTFSTGWSFSGRTARLHRADRISIIRRSKFVGGTMLLELLGLFAAAVGMTWLGGHAMHKRRRRHKPASGFDIQQEN